MSIVKLLGSNGRSLLILGLVAGIVLPDAGHALRPWLTEMVGGLLLLAALRVERLSVEGGLWEGLVFVGIAQLAMPLALASAAHLFGLSGANVSALILLAAACTISGAPNLVLMCGHPPDQALRNLVIGAFVLPVSIVPVLALWSPLAGSWGELAGAAARLLSLIALAAAGALLLRRTFDMQATRVAAAIDAASNMLMAVLVVALMSAIPTAWSTDRVGLFGTLAVACGANFVLQLVGYVAWARARREVRVSAAVGMGNRNMALFLAALPAATMDPLLLFIACYQIPMYLTPLVFGTLYARNGTAA